MLPPTVESYVEKSYARGSIPTVAQLRRVARKAGEKVSSDELRNHIKSFVYLARISSKKSKSKAFSTTPVPKIGNIFCDIAFLFPRWGRFNGGAVGFVAAVDASTQAVAAVPVKNKSSEEYERVIKELTDTSVFPVVKTIVSDQESALVSRKFREKLLRERNVEFVFLSSRSKAYMSEAVLRWIKNALAKTTAQRKYSGDPNYRRWVDALPNVVKTFNNRSARGTSYKRKDIDLKNYPSYLNQLFGTPDASLQWNTGTINASRFRSTKWLRRLFAYRVGEKVLVRKEAEYSAGRGNTFDKPSVTGRFGDRIRVIKARLLKRTLDPGLLVPVYVVKDKETRKTLDGVFYKEDLLPVRT